MRNVYICCVASHSSEPRVRNIYSPMTCLKDIYMDLSKMWGLFMCVSFASYGSESSVTDIHMGLWQMWGTFTGVLSAFYRSHPSVSNIYICFIFTKCMWIFIKLWGRFYKCLFLFYLPHTGMSWVSGISDLFASHRFEPTVRNIDISFIHLKCLCGIFTQVWGGCEDYLYLPKISSKIQ